MRIGRAKILVFGLAVLCLAALPATARAEMINFTGMGHRSVVSVEYQNALGNMVSGNFYAGEINWFIEGTTPTVNFYSYCVDILNTLLDPQEVAVRSTTDMADPTVGAKMAWLFNSYADGIRQGTSTSLYSLDVQAAALQVAIWETLYGDKFQLTTTGNIQTQMNLYLSALSGASFSGSQAAWLDTVRGGQDQITGVPEPATLLFLGLGGAMMARRRYTIRRAS